MKRTNAKGQLQAAADELNKGGAPMGDMAYNAKDDDDDDEGVDKSLPSENDLIKAMDVLVDAATGIENGQSVRQQDLASRMAAGDALSKSEKEELANLINGEVDDEDFLKSSTREELANAPAVVEGWEMSGYLDQRDSILAKSLDSIKNAMLSANIESSAVTARLAKGLHAVGMSNLQLRRDLADTQELVKSLMGQATSRPVAPKGRTSRVGQKLNEAGPRGGQLAKSEGGIPQDPAGQKQFLQEGLNDLIKSTEQGDRRSFGIVAGIDLVQEQAKLENYNMVSPNAVQLIMQHRGIEPTTQS